MDKMSKQPVWPERPHHAQPLEGILLLPFLRKLLLLRSLGLHKLAPSVDIKINRHLIALHDISHCSHLLELFSMSLSKFLNSSIADRVLMAPHPTLDMKSTGLKGRKTSEQRRGCSILIGTAIHFGDSFQHNFFAQYNVS